MKLRRLVIMLSLLGLLAASVPLALAQSPLSGKFVATTDGAVYVVIGSMRHRIQPTLVTADDLSGTTPGDGVATTDQLLALLGGGGAPAAGAGPAAAPPAAPPPAHPAAAILGTTTRICSESYSFNLAVAEVQWTNMIGATSPQGMFVLIIGNLTNTGSGSGFVLGDALKIRDERGRSWNWSNVSSAIQNQLGARPVDVILDRGRTERVVLAFDVAADAQRLELYGPLCS